MLVANDRQDVAQRVAAGERVIVDVDGVAAVSPSFSDELLVKLTSDAHESDHISVARLSRFRRHSG
jgi:hypothetical protein